MLVKSSFLAAAMSGAVIAVVTAPAAFGGEIKGPWIATWASLRRPLLRRTRTRSARSRASTTSTKASPGELPIRTQSYGQLVAAGLKGEFPSPGVACNGHSGFLAEA
jgi:hypothetical protein